MPRRLRTLRQSMGDLKLTYIQAVALVFSLERMYGGKYVPHIGSHSSPFLYLKILFAAGTARNPLGLSSSSDPAFPSVSPTSAADSIAGQPACGSSSPSHISSPTASTIPQGDLLGIGTGDGKGGGAPPALSSSSSSRALCEKGGGGGGGAAPGFWALSQRDYLLGLVGIFMPRRTEEERVMRESLMEFCSSMWYASLRSQGYRREWPRSPPAPSPTHTINASGRPEREPTKGKAKEEHPGRLPFSLPPSTTKNAEERTRATPSSSMPASSTAAEAGISSPLPDALDGLRDPFSSSSSSSSAPSKTWSSEALAGLYKRTLMASSSGASDPMAAPSVAIAHDGSPELCELRSSPVPPPLAAFSSFPLPLSHPPPHRSPTRTPPPPPPSLSTRASDMPRALGREGSGIPDAGWSEANRERLLLDSVTAISGSFFQGVTGRVLLFDAIATCMAAEESIRLAGLKRRREGKLASFWKRFPAEKGKEAEGGERIEETPWGSEAPEKKKTGKNEEKGGEGRVFDGASSSSASSLDPDHSRASPRRTPALSVRDDSTSEGLAASSSSLSSSSSSSMPPSPSLPPSRYYSSVQQDNILRIAQRIAVSSAMREKMEQLLRQEKQQGWIKRRLLLLSPHQPTTTPKALQQFSFPPSFYHRSSPSSSVSETTGMGRAEEEEAEGRAGAGIDPTSPSTPSAEAIPAKERRRTRSSGGTTTPRTSEDDVPQGPLEANREGGASLAREYIRWTPAQQRSAMLLVRMRPEEEVEDFIVRCEPIRQQLLRVLRRGRERRKGHQG